MSEPSEAAKKAIEEAKKQVGAPYQGAEIVEDPTVPPMCFEFYDADGNFVVRVQR